MGTLPRLAAGCVQYLWQGSGHRTACVNPTYFSLSAARHGLPSPGSCGLWTAGILRCSSITLPGGHNPAYLLSEPLGLFFERWKLCNHGRNAVIESAG